MQIYTITVTAVFIAWRLEHLNDFTLHRIRCPFDFN